MQETEEQTQVFSGTQSHILLEISVLQERFLLLRKAGFISLKGLTSPCLQVFKSYIHLFYTEFFGTALEKKQQSFILMQSALCWYWSIFTRILAKDTWNYSLTSPEELQQTLLNFSPALWGSQKMKSIFVMIVIAILFK